MRLITASVVALLTVCAGFGSSFAYELTGVGTVGGWDDINKSTTVTTVLDLSDFTADVASQDDCEVLRRAVERAIERFEPRLREVRVSIRQRESQHDRTLRMAIEALLWIEPEPQRITFDTIVQSSGKSVPLDELYPPVAA